MTHIVPQIGYYSADLLGKTWGRFVFFEENKAKIYWIRSCGGQIRLWPRRYWQAIVNLQWWIVYWGDFLYPPAILWRCTEIKSTARLFLFAGDGNLTILGAEQRKNINVREPNMINPSLSLSVHFAEYIYLSICLLCYVTFLFHFLQFDKIPKFDSPLYRHGVSTISCTAGACNIFSLPSCLLGPAICYQLNTQNCEACFASPLFPPSPACTDPLPWSSCASFPRRA